MEKNKTHIPIKFMIDKTKETYFMWINGNKKMIEA
jgi:hypothetical protein